MMAGVIGLIVISTVIGMVLPFIAGFMVARDRTARWILGGVVLVLLALSQTVLWQDTAIGRLANTVAFLLLGWLAGRFIPARDE